MVSVTNVGRPLKVLKPHCRFESCPDYTGRSSSKTVGGNIITVSQVGVMREWFPNPQDWRLPFNRVAVAS
jgi:hypothetical protein